MKRTTASIKAILILGLPFLLTACYTEDPGPLQETQTQFSVIDFDRLEMGSAFQITIDKGPEFNVVARGDRRNLDDLMVYKDGSTLIVRYDDNHNRKHQTYLTITLPELKSAHLSGASNSVIRGFEEEELDIHLSGASFSQVDVDAHTIHLELSGASNIRVTGVGEELEAELSGASILNSLDFDALEVKVNASGASKASVYAGNILNVNASGASTIIYDGEPDVDSVVSGGSTVTRY